MPPITHWSPRVAVAMLSLLLLAACAATTPSTASAPGSSPATSASSSQTETDRPVTGRADDAASTTTAAGPTATPGITTIMIKVDDPKWGPLEFDAIAAGNPDAAKRGRLVLLLHGFPETGEAYREQLVPLAAAGYYAVAPNQRGYSPKARPTDVSAYGVATLSADVLAMATALGADQFHVVGHDWGAAVAWVTAVASPHRVRSVTALSVPHPDAFDDAFNDPGGDQTKKSGYMKVFAKANSEDQFLANDNAGLKMIYGSMPKAKSDAYVKVLGSKEALGAALNWYRATAFPAGVRLGPVKVPTLFVWSTGDSAISRVGADATKQYVEAPYQYEVLEGISHWIPEQAPDRVRDLLLTHLAKVT